MKVYVSGKITGTRDYKLRFANRARHLKEMGYDPVNPVPIIEYHQKLEGRFFSHDECMKILIPYLDECDAINMLPGWEDSPGAREEYVFAMTHGKTQIDTYEV